MNKRGFTSVELLLALVLVLVIGLTLWQFLQISKLQSNQRDLHEWLSEPIPDPADPESAYLTLRAWQLRVTDVVCRLERLDQEHLGGGVILLCPDPNVPPPDPTGAPPPPPDFGF